MGYFLAVSAFRDRSVAQVVVAINTALTAHGVACRAVSESMDPATDAAVFDAAPFTIVLWPEYFNLHDIDLCAALTAALRTVAITTHTYDGDYWTLAVCRDGSVLDRFCTHPGYFARSPQERDQLATAWKGDAAVLARELGVEATALTSYLLHQDSSPPPKGARAQPDDEFDLSNMWVFTDLWRRLGARYPDDVSNASLRLRLSADFAENLPKAEPL